MQPVSSAGQSTGVQEKRPGILGCSLNTDNTATPLLGWYLGSAASGMRFNTGRV